MFITLKLPIWKEKGERDQHPGAFIILTIDMSDHRLHQHAIQISSHRHLWYSSRHYSFIVPHVCHAKATHTRARAHTHTHTAPIYLSLAELAIDVWVRVWNMLGQTTWGAGITFNMEQLFQRSRFLQVCMCVFLINIHTASDQLTSSDQFFVVYKGLILIF